MSWHLQVPVGCEFTSSAQGRESQVVTGVSDKGTQHQDGRPGK